jgi:predicted negative regulator of RcsB-dependent stress response
MANPADPTDLRAAHLVRDAEEALQQERLMEFWRQWGGTIIGMALMLVVGTAAGVAWRQWQQAKNEKSTAALTQIVETPAAPTPQMLKDLRPEHAAIAWLAMAGTALNDVNASKPEAERSAALAELFGNAAKTGDDTMWGWLARWNLLRMKMDDPNADAEALLKDYEKLAADKSDSALAALAWIDAALVAGERLKDPTRALDYIHRADKIVPRGTAVSAITADLGHLYEIRRQAVNAAANTPSSKEDKTP